MGPSSTHNGGTERVEGVGATGIEVGAVQALQEPHVVEALSLQRGRTGITTWGKWQRPPQNARTSSTLLFLPFCRQSICFSGEASQWICKGKMDCHCVTSYHCRVPPSLQAPTSARPTRDTKILSSI